MAGFTFTVSTAAGDVADSFTFSDANVDRFVAWALYAYPQLDENGDPKPVTNAVKAAAVREWIAGLMNGTKANVLRYEQNEAAQAAREAVGEIA
jgi:hypothetical protein